MSRVVRAVLLVQLAAAAAGATGVEVRETTLSTDAAGGTRVRLLLSWKNGWSNAKNRDAAWVFVKLATTPGRSRHARISATGSRVVPEPGAPAAALEVPVDGAGAFVYGAAPFRGDFACRVDLALDSKSLEPFEKGAALAASAFAIEMVHVPGGPFFVGDPDPVSLDFGTLYRVGEGGAPAGPFEVASEDPIRIGPEPGRIDYRAPHPQYQGDRQGPVPAGYPKGTRPFYLMKYEITQGQYADFLNTLGQDQSYFRAIHGGKDYAKYRGTIAVSEGSYAAGRPRRPANRVSWEDGIAFADWAGLRPMTDLEFWKAARGPGQPVAREFVWGTASTAGLVRVMRPDDDLETAGAADERLLSDETREAFGASYYWVLDLSGSVWEKVVSLGHPAGRAFRGTHGDGELSTFAAATNEDWPRRDEGGGGYGYLGGGFYEQGRPATEFNPYSPIAWRRFGAWGEAPRSLAYGFRGARSAP